MAHLEREAFAAAAHRSSSRLVPIISLRIGLGRFGPGASNHSLYRIQLPARWRSSYPGGNFGGNQLLDGSISLSPLYPIFAMDLHVTTAASLHQSFLWLHSRRA